MKNIKLCLIYKVPMCSNNYYCRENCLVFILFHFYLKAFFIIFIECFFKKQITSTQNTKWRYSKIFGIFFSLFYHVSAVFYFLRLDRLELQSFISVYTSLIRLDILTLTRKFKKNPLMLFFLLPCLKSLQILHRCKKMTNILFREYILFCVTIRILS